MTAELLPIRNRVVLGIGRILVIYMIATAIASILISAVIVVLIVADIASQIPSLKVSPVFVPSVLFVTIFLLYSKYSRKLNRFVKATLVIVLLFFSLSVNQLAITKTVFVLANYPKEKPFDEKLIFIPGPKNEQDALDHLLVLLAARPRII